MINDSIVIDYSDVQRFIRLSDADDSLKINIFEWENILATFKFLHSPVIFMALCRFASSVKRTEAPESSSWRLSSTETIEFVIFIRYKFRLSKIMLNYS